MRADTRKLPIQRTERPHLTLTISWETLRDCLGVARAYEGLTVSLETARRLACHAEIIPAILNSEGVPLDVGRKERLAGPELRKALIARDKGCTRPGYTRAVRRMGTCRQERTDKPDQECGWDAGAAVASRWETRRSSMWDRKPGGALNVGLV